MGSPARHAFFRILLQSLHTQTYGIHAEGARLPQPPIVTEGDWRRQLDCACIVFFYWLNMLPKWVTCLCFGIPLMCFKNLSLTHTARVKTKTLLYLHIFLMKASYLYLFNLFSSMNYYWDVKHMLQNIKRKILSTDLPKECLPFFLFKIFMIRSA